MATSLVRHIFTVSLALFGVAPMLALSGCAGEASERGAQVGFAVSSNASSLALAPAVKVGEVRVLNRHVSLQEPVVLGTSGDDVTITFALRQHAGVTVAMDAESLKLHAATAYSYPARVKNATPPYLGLDASNVRLDDGRSLACWTDEVTRRVLVQVHNANGTVRGEPVAVSPAALEVFGAPRAVTADGRHVVVTFFTTDEEGFRLVAASLESVR